MTPCYREYTGTIDKKSEIEYTIRGVIGEVDAITLKIKELPINKHRLVMRNFWKYHIHFKDICGSIIFKEHNNWLEK